MRKRIDDQLLVFNGLNGEYLAQIIAVKPKLIELTLSEQVRIAKPKRQVNLIFAPIKHTRMSFLLEKATELGATKLIPIQTKHSVVDKINLDKWNIYIKEATEQCRRLDMPEIIAMTSLTRLLKNWPLDKQIILCNEQENSLSIHQIKKTDNMTIMIGPEGGFSSEELSLLLAQKFITSVHLGENILRSETAALAALSILS